MLKLKWSNSKKTGCDLPVAEKQTSKVKPPDKYSVAMKSLLGIIGFLLRLRPNTRVQTVELTRVTASSSVKAGLVLVLFFFASASSASNYKSSVYEENIIECYARMAHLAYSDNPDIKKRLACDNRSYGPPSSTKLKPNTLNWIYSDFQEINHELGESPDDVSQHSITDVYQRCENKDCDNATSREIVFSARGTAGSLDTLIDKNAVLYSLVNVTDDSGEGNIKVGNGEDKSTLNP
jgi:hypothetical protein